MPDPIGGFTWHYGLAALLAYLLGSIPFGLLLTRLAGAGDLRAIGSGNIGATNVLRTGKWALALATLLLDAGKGVAAVIIGGRYGPDIQVTAALLVVIGHMFPVWLGFRGGKGVATTLGVLLALSWPVGVASCLIWVATAAVLHFSSLASILSILLAPGMLWLMLDLQRDGHLPMFLPGQPQHVELAALLAVLVLVKHHANIRRLVTGTESKLKLGRGN